MSRSRDNLIYMVNQIARFFQSQAHEKAVLGVADHIAAFWDPAMRSAVFAQLDADRGDLSPLARAGLEMLRSRSPRATGEALEREDGVSFVLETGNDAG